MNHTLFYFIFTQIGVMLAVAWLFGVMMKKLGQSAVLGELIGGVLLGPSLFGAYCPDIYASLFPSNQEITNSVDILLKLGMLFFMFAAGLEINLTHFRQYKSVIVSTSFFGGMIPFALGFGLVLLTPQLWGANENLFWLALFLGTVFSISALPVIARILIDLNLIESKIGLTIITSAMVNDVIGWAIFIFILHNFGVTESSKDFFSIILPLLLYTLAMVSIGFWLIKPFLNRLSRKGWSGGMLTFIAMLILLAAASAEATGVHAIFAVFLLGIVIGHENETQSSEPLRNANSTVQAFSLNFFAPIYFVSVGLKVNLTSEYDGLLVLTIIAIACLGKILGAGFGAWLGGMSWKEAGAVGVGLNARGAIGLVLASVALENHLIDQRIFVALVLMALFTSLTSGIFLKYLLVKKAAVD